MSRRFGTALCAAALLCAAPAAAQDAPVRSEIVEAVDTIVDEFVPLLDAMGIPAERFIPRDRLLVAMSAAMPLLANDRSEGEWDAAMQFEFRNTVSPNELEPDPEGQTVYTDARQCEEDQDELEIVHFRRYDRDGVVGYQCFLLFKGEEPGTWLLISRGFGEGPGRRVSSYFGVGMNVIGDAPRARQMLVDRIEANVALSSAIDDYALTLMLLAPRDGGPVSEDDAIARLERMRRVLDTVIAEEPASTR